MTFLNPQCAAILESQQCAWFRWHSVRGHSCCTPLHKWPTAFPTGSPEIWPHSLGGTTRWGHMHQLGCRRYSVRNIQSNRFGRSTDCTHRLASSNRKAGRQNGHQRVLGKVWWCIHSSTGSRPDCSRQYCPSRANFLEIVPAWQPLDKRPKGRCKPWNSKNLLNLIFSDK